jgi:hypothetical protein
MAVFRGFTAGSDDFGKCVFGKWGLLDRWDILSDGWGIPIGTWGILVDGWGILSDAWYILVTRWYLLSGGWGILSGRWGIPVGRWGILPAKCAASTFEVVIGGDGLKDVLRNGSIVPTGLIRSSPQSPAINRRAILETSLTGRRPANLLVPAGQSRIARQFTGGDSGNKKS